MTMGRVLERWKRMPGAAGCPGGNEMRRSLDSNDLFDVVEVLSLARPATEIE
jgi:hypothetical protein